MADHIDQSKVEGREKVNAYPAYSNQNKTEVTVGRALTSFIVDHIGQGRMEEKGKASARSLYSNQH